MAQTVKQQYHSTIIAAIENEGAVFVTDPGEINKTFKLFHKMLYTSQFIVNQEGIDNLVSAIHLPSLSVEEQIDLGREITLEEVKL